ncbi:MAG: methionyl-tRNA formyltransferase [Candidatus Limnocylindrales bacterium]
MTDGRARTVFIGSGGFGPESLRRLVDDDQVEVVGVVTAPPRPAGRHGTPTPTPIHGIAAELGIAAILTPDRLRAPASVAEVLALRPDLVVLADYGQIVPAALLAVRLGALNLHPSLLPRHRGATPVPAAILAGEAETGVTLMQMDPGLDTGPIVAQRRVALNGTETAPALEATLAVVAADLLAEHLGAWVRRELVPTPQPVVGASMTRPLRREDGRLDPSRSAVELERQVRAFQPWPGSFVDTAVGRIIVWAANVGDADGRGTRVPQGSFDLEGLRVGDGERLILREVQPAGGKRMPWDSFVRGRPSIIGSAAIPGP